MLAGVDCGSTFIKISWLNGGALQFASTADRPLTEICETLLKAGVAQVRLAGIGWAREIPAPFQAFEIIDQSGVQVPEELSIQARGAQRLLSTTSDAPGRFLLISVGTGVSYTFVDGDKIYAVPIGNCIGGGFLHGLGMLLGAKDFPSMVAAAAQGKVLDLLLEDMVPKKREQTQGKLVIANFGKMPPDAPHSDIFATLIHCVAVAIVRDVWVMETMTELSVPTDLVAIGTTVARNAVLRQQLTERFIAHGKRLWVPEHAEFALAVGALLSV